jgi:hypothetical protein
MCQKAAVAAMFRIKHERDVIRDELAVGMTNPCPERMRGEIGAHFLDVVESVVRRRIHLAS